MEGKCINLQDEYIKLINEIKEITDKAGELLEESVEKSGKHTQITYMFRSAFTELDDCCEMLDIYNTFARWE